MALVSIKFEIALTEINCGNCGGVYAINERYRETQYEKGGCWNCPYCRCGWGYSSNSENAKLKRDLAQKEKELNAEKIRTNTAQAEARLAQNEARAQKVIVTKLKKRAQNGVCPCCNRTFVNLQSHMKTKHPKFSAEEVAQK